MRDLLLKLLKHECPVVPAPKPEPLIQTIEALISDYDRAQLVSALQELEGHLGWKVFRAALIKEYGSSASYALEMASKTGKQIEAAQYAGIAQCEYDIATRLIEKYKDLLEQKTNVVENARPEE